MRQKSRKYSAWVRYFTREAGRDYTQSPRVEKIAVKDVKLRTFITEDKGRDDLVGHVYDVTYGVISRD